MLLLLLLLLAADTERPICLSNRHPTCGVTPASARTRPLASLRLAAMKGR